MFGVEGPEVRKSRKREKPEVSSESNRKGGRKEVKEEVYKKRESPVNFI